MDRGDHRIRGGHYLLCDHPRDFSTAKYVARASGRHGGDFRFNYT